MSWSDLGEWWRDELASDVAYDRIVTPLLLQVLRAEESGLYLDFGCGEGRVMRELASTGATVHGIDINEALVSDMNMPVVVGDMRRLPMRASTYDGVYMVLVLEHIEDHARVFAEAARITNTAGVLALIMNHPIWTAPDSTPITDDDGEVLWRPGEYFSNGSDEMRVGGGKVTFHHRTMSALLNAASEAGWLLEQMIERPHHEFEDQSGIPRLLACRWSLLP